MINCSAYIFGREKGTFHQYPTDASQGIFEHFLSIQGKSEEPHLMTCRRDRLMYYALVVPMAEGDIAAVAIVVNGGHFGVWYTILQALLASLKTVISSPQLIAKLETETKECVTITHNLKETVAALSDYIPSLPIISYSETGHEVREEKKYVPDTQFVESSTKEGFATLQLPSADIARLRHLVEQAKEASKGKEDEVTWWSIMLGITITVPLLVCFLVYRCAGGHDSSTIKEPELYPVEEEEVVEAVIEAPEDIISSKDATISVESINEEVDPEVKVESVEEPQTADTPAPTKSGRERVIEDKLQETTAHATPQSSTIEDFSSELLSSPFTFSSEDYYVIRFPKCLKYKGDNEVNADMFGNEVATLYVGNYNYKVGEWMNTFLNYPTYNTFKGVNLITSGYTRNGYIYYKKVSFGNHDVFALLVYHPVVRRAMDKLIPRIFRNFPGD